MGLELETDKDLDRRLVLLIRQQINVAIVYEGSGKNRVRATYYAKDDGRILARVAESYPETIGDAPGE
jgi:hypothetical protein